MKLTFLGTGDGAGIPVHGCDCAVCFKARVATEYRRNSGSAILEIASSKVLLDAGVADLCEKFPNGSLSAVLLSRFVADRLVGLFRVRHGVGSQIPVYSSEEESIVKHDLAIENELLEFVKITPYESIYIDAIRITPVPLNHTNQYIGYCIEHGYSRLAFLMGGAVISEQAQQFIREWRPSVLVLDATLPPQIPGQAKLTEQTDLLRAISLIESLDATRAVLTQIGHGLDEWLQLNKEYQLPEGVELAKDQMSIIL